MRALISVSDKTGVVEFATALKNLGWELIATGGTLKVLRTSGLEVLDIQDVTGFPEICEGRVKTLHPKVHGGLLARRDSDDHMAQLAENGIQTIELVCVNLYPFEATIAKEGVTMADAVENIDIGGPPCSAAQPKTSTMSPWCATLLTMQALLRRLRQTATPSARHA